MACCCCCSVSDDSNRCIYKDGHMTSAQVLAIIAALRTLERHNHSLEPCGVVSDCLVLAFFYVHVAGSFAVVHFIFQLAGMVALVAWIWDNNMVSLFLCWSLAVCLCCWSAFPSYKVGELARENDECLVNRDTDGSFGSSETSG